MHDWAKTNSLVSRSKALLISATLLVLQATFSAIVNIHIEMEVSVMVQVVNYLLVVPWLVGSLDDEESFNKEC